MTTDDALALVRKVESDLEGWADDEAAHVDQDAAYKAVLTAIADGTCDDPAGCARTVLEIDSLDFSRWYA